MEKPLEKALLITGKAFIISSTSQVQLFEKLLIQHAVQPGTCHTCFYEKQDYPFQYSDDLCIF